MMLCKKYVLCRENDLNGGFCSSLNKTSSALYKAIHKEFIDTVQGNVYKYTIKK